MRSILFFFCCFFCFTSNANSIKVGFIDINQIVNSSSLYKEGKDMISNQFEPKKKELLNLFNHIELLRSNIESIKKSSSNKSIEEELSKLLNLELSFKQETEIWQKTMDSKKIELLNGIETLINQVINEYAIQEQYDLILYENVAFASDKVNITDKIIELIENRK